MTSKYRRYQDFILFADDRYLHRPVRRIAKRKPTKPLQTQIEKMQLNIPGWQFVSNASYPLWIRILWGTLILLGITICLIHLFYQLRSFLSQPVMINIKISETPEIKLPNIVLCPGDLTSAIRMNFPYFNLSKFANISTRNGESRLEAMWREIRLPKEEMVKPSCGVELVVNGQVPDTCKDIPVMVEELFTVLGICYKYHFNYSLPYAGMYTLLIFRVPILKENFVSGWEPLFNIFFLIYDRNTELAPYTIMKSVRPVFSRKTHFTHIRSKEFRYVNRRSAKCVTDTAVISDCIQRCNEAFINKAVKCKLPFMNSTKPDCSKNQIMETISSIFPILTGKQTLQCEINCSHPCIQIVYQFLEEDKPSTNEEYIDLLFKFEDNFREVIEEVLSYEAFQFLSGVGGIFGLFTGISILSLLETFYIITVFILKRHSKNKAIKAFA